MQGDLCKGLITLCYVTIIICLNTGGQQSGASYTGRYLSHVNGLFVSIIIGAEVIVYGVRAICTGENMSDRSRSATYHITCHCVSTLLQTLHSHPFDWPVLIVSKTTVILWK